MKDDLNKPNKSKERRNELLYTEAFRSIPTAISITRLSDGIIVDVNNSFATMMSISPGEIVGKTFDVFDFYADKAERAELMRRVKENGSVGDYELIMKSATGRIINTITSAEIVNIDGIGYYNLLY